MASISWLDHLPQPPAPPHSSLLCSLHHLCIFSLLKSCHLISLPIGGRLADPYISLSLSHVLFMWILPGGEKKKKGKRKDDCFRTLVVLFIPGSIVLTLLPGNCQYLQLWYLSTLNAMYVTTCKYGENQIVLNVRIGQIMKKRFFLFFSPLSHYSCQHSVAYWEEGHQSVCLFRVLLYNDCFSAPYFSGTKTSFALLTRLQ